jgi:small subunit ribosomal protein S6
MYVIHPALQAGRMDDIINTVNTKVVSLKGKKLYFENWGKKKLAYSIDKQKYGTYVLMQFSMSGDGIKELMDEFEHNSNVLRYLINRIEKEDILESKEEISNVEENPKTEKKSKDEKESSQTDKEKTKEKVEE